jgi:hypothetical protein
MAFGVDAKTMERHCGRTVRRIGVKVDESLAPGRVNVAVKYRADP